MRYELAKELKDAGYEMDYMLGNFSEYDKKTANIWIPLDELIEACGEQKSLGLERNYGGMWTAYKDTQLWNDVDGYKYQARGTTPEEAVAKLWLALNKK